MSWDEKDWSRTWITGIPERFGKSPQRAKDTIINGERVCTIFQCSRDVCDLSYIEEMKLKEVAKTFGIMIEYQYISGPIYRVDYRNSKPTIDENEMKERSLIDEIMSIV